MDFIRDDLSSRYFGVSGSTKPQLSFQKRCGYVDWKKLASVDVDQVARNLDFRALQENISNVTFCNIESEVIPGSVDPNFLKLFKLAQLMIEYLLHSQEYLTEVLQVIEEKHEQTSKELSELQALRVNDQKQLQELRKENKKRRKMLLQNQQNLQAEIVPGYFKCEFCPKVFVSAAYLQSHHGRRHGDKLQTAQAAIVNDPKIEELEKELSQIHNRLKETQEELEKERASFANLCAKAEQETVARKEEVKKEIEFWKEQQQEIQKKELESVKEMFLKEMQELNEKHLISEQALMELRAKYNTLTPPSNLGVLVDAENMKVNEELHKQREETTLLKEQLQLQLTQVQKHLEETIKGQEKQWRAKLRQVTQEHALELEKLNNALEQSVKHLQKERQQTGNQEEHHERQIRKLLERSRRQEMRLKNQEKQIHELATKPALSQFVSPIKSPPTPPPRKVSLPRTPQVLEKERENQYGFVRSERLFYALQKNPNLLEQLKCDLEEDVEEMLQKRGVTKNITSLSTPVLKKKLALLKKKRKVLGEKYDDFYTIRNHYKSTVDEAARIRAKEASKNAIPNKSPKNPFKKMFDTVLSKVESSKKPEPSPKLAPRRAYRDVVQHKANSESSLETSEESEEELDKSYDSRVKVSALHQSPEKWNLTKTSSPKSAERMYSESEEEFSDTVRPVVRRVEPNIVTVHEGRGQKVAEITQVMEQMISNRSIKPPSGAVDVLKPKTQHKNPSIVMQRNQTSDHDDLSDSSDESVQTNRKKQSKALASKEMGSLNNTGSSSCWDSSSSKKDLLPGKKEQNPGTSSSTGKGSLVTVTSWGSDDDLSVEEIE
ncbi:zinc finger protein DZIP1L-like isoform X2 [Limulus polyphemus]|uniref:Zinc finger protein DZIP1L-like isoform X2 n=1 Tax=Limulus polyphemus TaxID=6850 RepID=A0ABM1S2V6_LIMPO|nr:zinc finger protein DZIP1L-like isoform X2 [Limulus polyphemus]